MDDDLSLVDENKGKDQLTGQGQRLVMLPCSRGWQKAWHMPRGRAAAGQVVGSGTAQDRTLRRNGPAVIIISAYQRT